MLRPLCCLAGLLASGLLANGQANPDHRLDSVRAVLQAHPQADTNRVKTLHELVWELRTRDPAAALQAAQEDLALAERLHFDAGIAKAYNLQGIIYSMSGAFDKALPVYAQAKTRYLALHNYRMTGNVLNNIANVLTFQGHYQQAVAAYLEDLRLEEEHGTPLGRAITLGNLGNVYTSMGQPRQALTYYQQLLQLAKTSGDKASQASSLLNMALAYRGLKKLPQAQAYLQQALMLARQTANRQAEADALYNLGGMAFDRRELGPARQLHEQALAIERALGNQTNIGRSQLALGDVAELQRRYPAALTYYQQGLKLAEAVGDNNHILLAHQGLANTYGALSDYRRAYDEQQTTTEYKDTLLSENVTRQITEMQARYETGQKDARNRLLAAELRTQQQISRRRRVLLWASLAIAALLAGAGYLLYTRRRLRREVEFAQERQQLERLRAQAVLEAEETERRRIGADLHDGIGQLLTAARLNLGALGEQLPLATEGQRTLLATAQEVVDESFREVRSISHNLMPNALIKRGLSQAVRDFLNQIAPDGHLRVEVQVVGLDQGPRLPPTVESVLFRVIQELVQNIVKHARATEITLQLIQGDDDLTVMVEDNGVGFDPAALGPEAGIGLRNVETRMAYLGGRADFDAAPGRGTIVTLEVPV